MDGYEEYYDDGGWEAEAQAEAEYNDQQAADAQAEAEAAAGGEAEEMARNQAFEDESVATLPHGTSPANTSEPLSNDPDLTPKED